MFQRAYSVQVLPHENVLRAIIEVPDSARSVDVSAGVAKIADAEYTARFKEALREPAL